MQDQYCRAVFKGIVRKIIHIDMDAFFASVEQPDYPELRSQKIRCEAGAMLLNDHPGSNGLVGPFVDQYKTACYIVLFI